MFFSVLLIIAASSTVCGTAEPLDSVPPASRNVAQHGAQQAVAGNASQLAESGSNSVASPSETTNLMVAASLSLQSVLEGLQAEMQHLQTEMEAKEQTFQAELQQLRNETVAKDQLMQEELQRIQAEFEAKDQQLQAEFEAKDQLMQAEIQQLQSEMAAKDLRIQNLEQRDYIERSDAFTSGSGSRYVDVTATFGAAFRTTPVVTVGLMTLDNYPGHIRVSAGVTSVSTTGLTVRISTWADSRLYYARVHWMACA
ncbi:hypothetical protein Bbelb_285480 [Branchiostoma belcheri]|nr:hypothetical protein Bbelb_285480 [Branchiostoma belcheri]